MRYLVGLLLAIQLGGCSNQQVYDSLRQSQQNECDSLPWAQRQECLKKLRPEYRDYDREQRKIKQTEKG